MKRLIYILPIVLLAATGCNREPFADARIVPNPAWVGEDIEFTNLSLNTEYSEWNMGDGSTSDAFNVVHYYVDPGIYTVTLRSFGRKGAPNVASFEVDVVGSELKVEVKEYEQEYAVEGASVLLFATRDDWFNGDASFAVAEAFTNQYGEAFFDNLSYQKYYVDVYYRVGNEGYVNWLLGEEDIGWVETQILPGGYDHTFIAYVDFVTFNDKKKSAGRPVIRPPLKDLGAFEKSAGKRPLKENKISTKKEGR